MLDVSYLASSFGAHDIAARMWLSVRGSSVHPHSTITFARSPQVSSCEKSADSGQMTTNMMIRYRWIHYWLYYWNRPTDRQTGIREFDPDLNYPYLRVVEQLSLEGVFPGEGKGNISIFIVGKCIKS